MDFGNTTFGGAITVSFWAYWTGTGGMYERIIDIGSGTNIDNIVIFK